MADAPGGDIRAGRRRFRPLGSMRLWSLAGVIAAAVIAVCANVLVHRFYTRWDMTRAGLYTLSEATLETLRSLQEPVEVIVFLSASDPLRVSVEHMLGSYRAETRSLKTRFVDPDRDPGEFLALQNKYGIIAGKTEDGRVVTDASLVVAHADRHWFITTEDMVVYDDKDDRARPALEQSLTEGIRNVLAREKTEVCFTQGHQELSPDDGSSQGLAELKFRIQKDNYLSRAVDLVSPAKSETLDGCAVVVVAGPDVAFSPSAARRLRDYFARGGNLLLLLNPVLDEASRIRSSGLEPVTALGGVELGADFIIEQNPSLRLPQGLGETFFVEPQEHDVTAGLFSGGEVKFRPVLSAAQSQKATAGGPGKALLTTSNKAFSVKDIRPFVEEGREVEKRAGDSSGPFHVAMAAQLPAKSAAKEARGGRLVVAGSANVAFGQAWRDPTLLGNRLFAESALSWLAARPKIVSVPEKPSHAAGLNLTEENLGEILRYVLVYMPGAALVLGLALLYMRRREERRSRRDKKEQTTR